MRTSRFVRASIALGAVAALFGTREAAADPPPMCNAITQLGPGGTLPPAPMAAPAVVYVTGSSALKPLVASLAPAIFAATSPQRPATIVYLSQGSCAGVASVVSGTTLPTTTAASYWDPNSTQADDPINNKTQHEQSCTLVAGTNSDIGASDVFAETCGASIQGLPVQDFQGPIQSMTFAVNQNSKESSISAEAAYLTFGLHTLPPWTDSGFIFRRNSGSGTQAMIAAAINVDPKIWTGQDKGSSDGVYGALVNLLAQSDVDKGIGILSADYSSKSGLKQLAYQHYGQRCGYKPDIVASDKRNTREGRYAIWGPIHLLSQVDASGLAKKLEARDFIGYLLGTTAPPLGIDLIRTTNLLDVVPPCAMKVQRKAEMGPITPFTPTRSCNCAYDKAGTGATTCKVCSTNADCSGAQSCNFGYCE